MRLSRILFAVLYREEHFSARSSACSPVVSHAVFLLESDLLLLTHGSGPRWLVALRCAIVSAAAATAYAIRIPQHLEVFPVAKHELRAPVIVRRCSQPGDARRTAEPDDAWSSE